MNLDDRFLDFHLDNPEVYDELVKLTCDAKAAGKRKIGIRMIWEVARWNLWLKTTDPVYRLNNNYTSRYARLIMKCETSLADIFDVRTLRS